MNNPIQGSYAARSTPAISPIWLIVGMIGAFVVGLAISSDSDEIAQPAVSTETAELHQELRGTKLELARLRAEAEVETPEPEPAEVDPGADFYEILDLKEKNAALRGRVSELESEVDRYRQALDKSIVELNRIQARQSKTAASKPRRNRSGASVDPHKFVFPRQPYSSVVSMGRIDIEGSIHNANSKSVSGVLYVTVLQGSREIDSKRKSFSLKAKEVREYSMTINNAQIRQGTAFNVKAEWDSR